MHRDDVRLERYQVGNATHFRVGVRIRPGCQTCIIDGVIAAEPFVWAESLELHWSEGGLIDVGAWNVPARRKAGLVEDERMRGFGDGAVTMADHEVTGGLANVDAVVAVSGMPHDPFVFFVERVHSLPGERDPSLQFARVGRERGVLPRPSRCYVLACPDRIPGRGPEIGVLDGAVGAFEGV